MDANNFLISFVDNASPLLDTYEQAIYLYLVRNGPLCGERELVFPIESATKRLALGIAKKGARISRDVVRKKLRSLQDKGFIQILGVEYKGTRILCLLPEEIPGLAAKADALPVETIEEMDFYTDATRRESIFHRDGNRCFYCSRVLTGSDRVLDHVVSRQTGSNGYRNLVACCLGCNSRKKDMPASDFLRLLFRERILGESELKERLSILDRLAVGELKPVVA